MPHRARLLGFAFTNADFLFETDAGGTILFAAGAANDLVREPDETLVGRPAARLFKPSEGARFATFAKALKSGDRAGPFKLTLATGTEANLAMFRLPDNDARISCTLSRPGSRAATPQIDPRTGLATRDGFMAAAERAGDKAILTLVDVPGLPELCARLSPDHAEALMQHIGTSLKASGASAAGQLSDTSFGALAPATRGGLGLAAKIADAIAAGGLKSPKMCEVRIGLLGGGLTQAQRMLALRYVVERFSRSGKCDDDIATAFAGMMDETQARLAGMTRTLGEGSFALAYQPVGDLASGKVSHYEALARFAGPQDADETVKFIEALGIADVLDLAVASKVLDEIAKCDADIAFPVSGATIASPAGFGMLAALLARRRKLSARTMIEITDIAAITDLAAAGKAVQALRGMGYRVGLDDLGAGAAALNCLYAFAVDFVKFGGAPVGKIGTSTRDDALLSGLTGLCGELGATAIAAGIETEAMAGAARDLGFHQGQGKWLGAPTLDLPAAPVAPGKRRGIQESWG